MSQVLPLDSAVHGVNIFRSQCADELDFALEFAARNSAHIVFGVWSGGAVPANRYFHPLGFLDGLAIGRASLGYGVRNLPDQGRLGIYLKAYVDEIPKLLEFASQKDPFYVRNIMKGMVLNQNKGRLAGQFTKNGENLGRLLIRVPHR